MTPNTLTPLLSKTFIIAVTLGLGLTGCATWHQQGVELPSDGPAVLNTRSVPAVTVLNKDLQPNEPSEIIADVKDFKYNILDVRLKFEDVPLEVPMENIGGTMWRAELTPRQLQMLAVSGKTVRYKANVIARNSKGDTASSPDPVYVSIRSPDLSAHYG